MKCALAFIQKQFENEHTLDNKHIHSLHFWPSCVFCSTYKKRANSQRKSKKYANEF